MVRNLREEREEGRRGEEERREGKRRREKREEDLVVCVKVFPR